MATTGPLFGGVAVSTLILFACAGFVYRLLRNSQQVADGLFETFVLVGAFDLCRSGGLFRHAHSVPAVRIYADESGTHGDDWLIIGMLFVPNHGKLHNELIQVKKTLGYLNGSPKRKATYKESTLKHFKSQRDVDVADAWFDVFLRSDAWFRAVVIDWSIWDGRYFGGPFEPDALKRRRAYKKWAEQLLQPEFSTPLDGQPRIRDAHFYLDKLRVLYGYDLLDHLQERFSPPETYMGTPFITEYQHTDSWRDANQCLQLCDLLVGSIYQTLVPAARVWKTKTRDCLAEKLKPFGVDRLDAGFWKQYNHASLREKHPRFSAWYWQPEEKRGGVSARKGRKIKKEKEKQKKRGGRGGRRR